MVEVVVKLITGESVKGEIIGNSSVGVTIRIEKVIPKLLDNSKHEYENKFYPYAQIESITSQFGDLNDELKQFLLESKEIKKDEIVIQTPKTLGQSWPEEKINAVLENEDTRQSMPKGMSMPMQELWKKLADKKYKTNWDYGEEDYPGEYGYNAHDKVFDDKIKETMVKHHNLPHRIPTQMGTDMVMVQSERTLEDMIDEIENQRNYELALYKRKIRKIQRKEPYVMSGRVCCVVVILGIIALFLVFKYWPGIL